MSMGIEIRIAARFPKATKYFQRLFKRKPQSSPTELPPPPTASPPREWRLTVVSSDDDEQLINTTHDVIITNPNPEIPVFQLTDDNDDDPEIIGENGNPIEIRIAARFPKATKYFQRLFKRKPQSSPTELPPPSPPPPTPSPPPDSRLTVSSDDEEKIEIELTNDVIITNPNPNPNPETPVFQLTNDTNDDGGAAPQNPEVLAGENGNPVETENPQPIRGHELVKSIFTLGVGTIALIIYQNGKSQEIIGHIVLTGLSAGCIAIWKGIVWRDLYPQISIYVEQAGIATVLISFKILVASSLPKEFAWIPILMGVLCIPTFVVAVLPRQTTHNIIIRVSTLALLRENVTENQAVEEEG